MTLVRSCPVLLASMLAFSGLAFAQVKPISPSPLPLPGPTVKPAPAPAPAPTTKPAPKPAPTTKPITPAPTQPVTPTPTQPTTSPDPVLDLPLTDGDTGPVWDENAKPKPPAPPTTPPDDGDDPDDLPPPTIYGEDLETEGDSIFYVLDQSCSMGWDPQSYTGLDGSTTSGVRWDRARVELARSVSSLSDNFEFNIICFDCSTRQWQPTMQEANDTNKAAGMAWVNSLSPGGATGTGPATAQALGEKDNELVVLLTDGAPNCGASPIPSGHRTMISNANTQGATINVFGISAYSGSYKTFCQQVASDSGGAYFDVP